MKTSGDGLTLWYGDEETAAPSGLLPRDLPVSVTVGVRPASLTNSVEIEYRVNDGPKRVLRSTPTRYDTSGSKQFFKAVFPYLAPGSSVSYAPVLNSLGRRIGPVLDTDRPSTFSIADTPSPVRQGRSDTPAATAAVSRGVPSKTREPFPHALERLAQVQAFLEPGVFVGPTPDGLRVNFPIKGGHVVGERFNATVESGGADALRVREDGTAILAVRTTLMTDDGTRIYTEYSGVLDLGEDGYQRALEKRFPPNPKVYLAPRFVCASPSYGWLNRLQCMGIGYVTIASLEVNYDLYAFSLPDAPST